MSSTSAKVVSRGKFYDFFHRRLWLISEQAAKAARPDRLENWESHSITAMVFAFHTVEAYCNFVLQVLDPEIWAKERTHFAKGGVLAKIDHVLTLVKVTSMTRGKRPLQTVIALKRFRDRIAHGRYETQDTVAFHDSDAFAPYPDAAWRKQLMPKEKKLDSLADVASFLQCIHEGYLNVVKRRIRNRTLPHTMWQDPDALHGVLSVHTVHTQLAPERSEPKKSGQRKKGAQERIGAMDS